MAQRILLADRSGALIPPPPALFVDEKGVVLPNLAQQLETWLLTVVSHVNRIRFGTGNQSTKAGNVWGQWIEFIAPSVADTEFEVDHGLGETPVAYWVGRSDRAGQLYDSNIGGWNPRNIFFKSDTASKLYKILLVG